MRHFALLVLFASAISAQGQKVTLRLNPPAGKTYAYAMVTTTKQSTPQGASTAKQTVTSLMKVVKNTGGKVTLETSFKDAKVTMTGPGANMAKNLEGMLNTMKTTAVLDSLGKPVDTTGVGAAGMQAMMAGSGGMNSMYSFPKEPVGVGSKWSSVMDLNKVLGKSAPNMKMTGGKMPITMTLKRFETRGGKRVAVIGVSMTGTMSMAMGAGSPGGGSMKSTMNSTGEMVLDVATGMPVEVTSVAKNVTMLGTMKMDQTTTSSLKLK